MLRTGCILVFIVLSYGFTLAQQPPEFYTRYFTTENGLPSNGIKGMEWDEETGFLWIATEAGISRFNGLDFKNFTKDNTPFIVSERMLFMVRNNAGKIYAADMTGSIMTVNRNKLLYFGKEHKTGEHSKLFSISVSDTLFYNKKEYRDSRPFSLSGNWILPYGDTACFIIYNKRIYKFSAGMHEARRYADSNMSVRSGFKLRDKYFVVDEEYNIHELNEDPSKNSTLPLINEDGTPFILSDPNNRIFWTNGMENPVIVNGKYAWQLHLSGNKIVASLICNEIPSNALIENVQYSPQKKILFLGTNSKGIIVMNRTRLDAMKKKQSSTNERNAYYSQTELPDGNVLTGEGHIIGKNSLSTASYPITGRFGNYLSTTSDSILWYSPFNPATGDYHLRSYNSKTGHAADYKKIQSAENLVHAMTDGRKLITTEFGIGWLAGDSVDYIYRHPAITFNTATLDFIEITPGIILLASCSGILQFNTSTKKMDTLMRSDGYCVRSLWKYKDYIFFGTYGKGIFAWKNGLLKSIPIDKKKYLLHAHCFMPDEYGFCWISTNRGLFKADINELINAYERNNASVYYHYYGKTDGMEMLEMNGGCTPCALQLKNKTFSFPTMDGLLWLDPARAKPILPAGEIFIDDITADNTGIDHEQQGDILLPANTKDITIHLAFSAWCNKENIYVDYQLNDTLNWKQLNTDNDAILRFSNLTPGGYTLRFRKLNGFGINNYTYKTIYFRIIIPWYKKWWFAVLMVMVAAGLILLFVQGRTRQLKKNQLRLENLVSQKTKELQETNAVLEKNNSIKTRLISIISHDIVTPLKFLTVAGKNLLEKKQLMSEELQNETISEMTNTSQDLQLLSTNILNWIKYQTENRRLAKETFNMHELVNQVISVLGSFANHKQIHLVNETAKDLAIYQFFEPLKIIVYNLVSNAINFTDQGKVIISNTNEQGKIIVSVKDDGVGITPEQIQNIMTEQFIVSSANMDNRKGNGLGYLIIKDLVKMMGVSLQIESKKGSGTTVHIII